MTEAKRRRWWERLVEPEDDAADGSDDEPRPGTITPEDLAASGGAWLPQHDGPLPGGPPGRTQRRLGGRWRLPSQPPPWVESEERRRTP